MATADELLDAPSADDLLDQKKNSPTGLSPLIRTAIDSVPGLGAMSRLSGLPNIPLPKQLGGGKINVGKTVQDTAAMTAGSMPGNLMIGAGVATGQPEVAAAGVGLSAAGAGAGNVISGEISDIADHPENAQKVFNLLFNPATPQMGQQIVQMYQKDPEGTLQGIKTELSKVGMRFTSGAISQIISLGLSSLSPSIPKTTSMPPSVIPGAKDLLDEYNIKQDPSMYTTGKFSRVLKGMANEGLLSSDAMHTINEGNKQVLTEAGKDLTTEMAGRIVENTPPSELAEAITAPKRDLGEPLQKEIERRMYNNPELNGVVERVPIDKQVDTGMLDAQGKPLMKTTQDFAYQRTGGLNIPISKFKNLAQEEMAVLQMRNYIGSDEATNLLKKINGLDDNVNFATAHEIRSDILDAAREVPNGNAKRILTKLVFGEPNTPYGIDNLMNEYGEKLNGPALDQYRQASAFFKEGKEVFNNDLLAKSFISDDTLPERVGKSIFRGGNTTQVQQLKDVFQRVDSLVSDPANAAELSKVVANNPDAQKLIDNGQYSYENMMNKVRSGSLQTLIGRYTRQDPTSLTGSKINYQGILNDLDPKQNPEEYATLKELFSEQQIDKLRDWSKAGYLAVENNPESFSRAVYWMVRIMGGAVGAVAGLAVGHPGVGLLAGEGTALLGEGKLASYLLTNPEASQMLIKGVKLFGDPTASSSIKKGTDLMIKAATAFMQNKEQQ